MQIEFFQTFPKYIVREKQTTVDTIGDNTQNNFQHKNLLGNEESRAVESTKRLPLK